VSVIHGGTCLPRESDEPATRTTGALASSDGTRAPYRYRYSLVVAVETYSRHLIRMARREAELSQTELAARARTSQAAVSAYESGKRSPSVDTLCRLLAAAGFEVRMRLASPDGHEGALERARELLPADQVAAHQERERQRTAHHKGT